MCTTAVQLWLRVLRAGISADSPLPSVFLEHAPQLFTIPACPVDFVPFMSLPPVRVCRNMSTFMCAHVCEVKGQPTLCSLGAVHLEF